MEESHICRGDNAVKEPANDSIGELAKLGIITRKASAT